MACAKPLSRARVLGEGATFTGDGKLSLERKGHEFTRAVKLLGICRPLASEVCLLKLRRLFPQPLGSRPR